MSKKSNNHWSEEELNDLVNLKSLGYTSQEICDFLYEKYGRDVTSSAIRHKVRSLTKNKINDESGLYHSLKQKRSTQVKNTVLNKHNRAILDNNISKEKFLDSLEEVLSKTKIKLHKKVKINKPKKKTKRTLIAHVSDTHIGSDICGEELDNVNAYGPIEEARRHALFFKHVAQYKLDRRKETDLVLCLNGDLLQGVIHDHEVAAPQATQFARALSIYSQGISYLAQHFSNIRVVCTVGNHARFMHKSNKGRQSSQKWDSMATILHVSLKNRFKEYKNIEFIIPSSPYAILKVQGHNIFMTHGDTVLNVGNVSKTINISSLNSQINEFSSALNKKLDVVMVGHVHKSTYQTLDNGTEVVINGCLSGTDPFAQSIGILHSNPSQQIFEVTENHPVGDMRFVKLKEADKDKSLDKIIEPLKSKF